jgi:hypothetical protein
MSAITKTRYIPKDSTPIELEDVSAVVYVYQFGKNFAGIAYARKAYNSTWHYQYGNEANAIAAANRWLVSMRDVEQMKAANRAAQQAVSKGTVTLHQIASETHSHGGGSSMSDMRVAVKDHFLSAEEPFVKRPQCHGGEKSSWYIPMQHGWCNLWDGRPEYCSWYA